MTYESLDTIPLKLFIKIQQTKNLTLLTDNRRDLGRLTQIWEDLQKEYSKLDPDNTVDKTLKTIIKIEIFYTKYKTLELSSMALKFDRDIELENMIRELGYKLREESFMEDLNIVDRDKEAILLKIEEYTDKLPKYKGKKATNIDEVILGYCSATGLQFNPNEITVTQFYALKKIFDDKLKVLEEQRRKIKK